MIKSILSIYEMIVNIHMHSLRQLPNIPLNRTLPMNIIPNVINMQINKCFTSMFGLYLTVKFQTEAMHSSGGCETSQNKKIDMNFN